MRMSWPTFLLLILATTCQGDNSPTGLIVTGGKPLRTSIETFPPIPNCTIPPFPHPGRWAHTVSVVENGRQLVACGGYDCISWRSGQDEWTHYATLSQERSVHAAVVLQTKRQEKIFLIGGFGNSSRTGEIVKDGTQLTLQNSGEASCAVAFKTGFVTIGGDGPFGGDGPIGKVDIGGPITIGNNLHGKVDRYNSEGKYLDSLPDLFTPRAYHACTSFFTNGEQALLVAGGFVSGQGEPESSTEIYSNGVWRPGGNLPRAMNGLRAAHLNQQVVITGGWEGVGWRGDRRDEVLQYNVETETWTPMENKMQSPRSDHAIVEVNLATFGCAASGLGESTTSATTTTGLDPLLALLTCLILVSCRRCNNSSTRQGENKQSL